MDVRCLNAAEGPNWKAINGDSCDVLAQLPDASVGFSVYSPPFGDLFVYSESANDMGNSSTDGEFFGHYEFIIKEKLRVTKPGRMTAVHCSDLPTRKSKDGYIGTKPFSDQITAAHEAAGWHFVRRVTIWRDPVAVGATDRRNSGWAVAVEAHPTHRYHRSVVVPGTARASSRKSRFW